MYRFLSLTTLLFYFNCSFAQIKITIPDTLSGKIIDLTIAKGVKEFVEGKTAHTIGYNGNYLGNTIILHKGQNVKFNVYNNLTEPTSTHWHGLHVSPANDGSPHNPIMPNEVWSPEFTVMDNAATYWYHPHLHEKTLKQVVKGAAGLIIVRDSAEESLNLPRTYGKDDFPLALQFLTLDETGDIVEDDEADNTIMVNGTINGELDCPAELIRLRLLNASSHRVFNLGFENNMIFHQICGDAGLLQKPVRLTRLILGPGERAEVIVNLTNRDGELIKINQYGNELPIGFPGGPPMGMAGNMMQGPLDNKITSIMTLKVIQGSGSLNTLPSYLTTLENLPISNFNRNFGITAQPMMSMTNFFINNKKFDMEEINFKSKLGATETWIITNQTMMAHPFHVHGNHFFITEINGQAPAENLTGRKDVVLIPPMNGNVKLVTTFSDFSNSDVPYMYHCHILSHEDNGMMGQFLIENTTTKVLETTNELALMVNNPFTNKLNISGNSIPDKFVTFLRIISIDGKQVFQTSIKDNNFNFDVETTQWSKGVFILNFIDSNQNILLSKQVVKM